MAVYTQVGAEAMAALLARYDVGTLVSAKGVAEGVENSNYMVETTRGRYFLTLYEGRTDPADLPFFIDQLAHLKARGLPVPAFIADRDGTILQVCEGRPACLIEFLTGVSVSRPDRAKAHAVGAALGRMHGALADFGGHRGNALSTDGWARLIAATGRAGFDAIRPGLADRVEAEFAYLSANWPVHLPRSVIHADLFPDNVLMLDDAVTGLIDFYFSCTDIRAYDIAVTHAAWCFSADGSRYDPALGAALIAGYESAHPLLEEERAALSVLARGASLRFLLTRAYDWINTPADAIVVRKDPVAFLLRLDRYAADDLFRPGNGVDEPRPRNGAVT